MQHSRHKHCRRTGQHRKEQREAARQLAKMMPVSGDRTTAANIAAITKLRIRLDVRQDWETSGSRASGNEDRSASLAPKTKRSAKAIPSMVVLLYRRQFAV
jgi:hypothetical protein